MSKTKKKPYDERDDLEKIASQWRKLSALNKRKDFSAAIVRCATAAEIAANLAIRSEFTSQSTFDAKIVDSFLIWTNGLRNKMDRLLLPIRFKNRKHPEFKKLKALSESLYEQRNDIVHSGRFSSKNEATKAIEDAKLFIEALIGIYHPGYKVPEKNYRK